MPTAASPLRRQIPPRRFWKRLRLGERFLISLSGQLSQPTNRRPSLKRPWPGATLLADDSLSFGSAWKLTRGSTIDKLLESARQRRRHGVAGVQRSTPCHRFFILHPSHFIQIVLKGLVWVGRKAYSTGPWRDGEEPRTSNPEVRGFSNPSPGPSRDHPLPKGEGCKLLLSALFRHD